MTDITDTDIRNLLNITKKHNTHYVKNLFKEPTKCPKECVDTICKFNNLYGGNAIDMYNDMYRSYRQYKMSGGNDTPPKETAPSQLVAILNHPATGAVVSHGLNLLASTIQVLLPKLLSRKKKGATPIVHPETAQIRANTLANIVTNIKTIIDHTTENKTDPKTVATVNQIEDSLIQVIKHTKESTTDPIHQKWIALLKANPVLAQKLMTEIDTLEKETGDITQTGGQNDLFDDMPNVTRNIDNSVIDNIING